MQNGEIILYQPDNSVQLEVRMDGDTVWHTQTQMVDLLGTKRQAITKHLKNIFAVGELKEDAVCSILELTATDGKKYLTKIYSLDTILSVGYRVTSIVCNQLIPLWMYRSVEMDAHEFEAFCRNVTI